jgi:hypothetical protein
MIAETIRGLAGGAPAAGPQRNPGERPRQAPVRVT